MLQTLIIESDNEQALTLVKKLASELGLKFSSYKDEQEDDDDLADFYMYKNDERISWAEAKQILNNTEKRNAL